MSLVGWGWWLGVGLVACSPPQESVSPSTGPLPAGVVAQVGEVKLETRQLEELLVAQPGRSPTELVQAWSRDALLAQAAGGNEPGFARTVVLSHRLVQGWMQQATVPAEPSAQEIAEAREQEWQKFDRPTGYRVHHAVVMKPRGGAALAEYTRASKQLGEALHATVVATTDFDTFSSRAKQLPLPPGLELRAEQLPAMDAAGRAIEGGGGFDPIFAGRAAALSKPGATSEPFETPFGMHVVQLEEITPAERLDDAAIAAAITPDLRKRRVQKWQGLTVQRRREHTRIELVDQAEARLGVVVEALLNERAAE